MRRHSNWTESWQTPDGRSADTTRQKLETNVGPRYDSLRRRSKPIRKKASKSPKKRLVSNSARKMGDSQVEAGATFEHRVFVAGFTLHVLSGTLATIATFLDFNWQSPAAPGFGDPAEPLTAISVPLTAFMSVNVKSTTSPKLTSSLK